MDWRKFKKRLEKVAVFDNLQKEFNSIIGDITFDKIKTIDIELRELIKCIIFVKYT